MIAIPYLLNWSAFCTFGLWQGASEQSQITGRSGCGNGYAIGRNDLRLIREHLPTSGINDHL